MRIPSIAAAVLLGTACAAHAKTIKVARPGNAVDGTYSTQAGSGFARSQGRTVPLTPVRQILLLKN